MTDAFTTLIDRGVPEPAQLTNMRLGLMTMLECQQAPEGSPRLGILYGPSGYGKSVAAATVASRLGAAYVVARSTWTKKSMLKAIAAEIGIARPARDIDDIATQITDQLLVDPQPLIVDEVDYLIKKEYHEIIRDILDHGRVPILLIGEETLPASVKKWERFDNRILVATPAQPSSVADAFLLRDYYCPRVAVADDLVAAIVKETRGVTRRIVTNLQKAQQAAISEGLAAFDLAAWGDRRFYTGAVPTRRAA